MTTVLLLVASVIPSIAIPRDLLPEHFPPKAPLEVTLLLQAEPEHDYSRPHASWDTFFSFTTHNGMGVPLKLCWAGFSPNHLVYLRDADGRELPLTSFGKIMRNGTLRNYGNRDHNDPFEIAAGEYQRSGMNFELRRLYDPKPGTYTLTVEYFEQQTPRLRIVSNPVAVVVPDERPAKG